MAVHSCRRCRLPRLQGVSIVHNSSTRILINRSREWDWRRIARPFIRAPRQFHRQLHRVRHFFDSFFLLRTTWATLCPRLPCDERCSAAEVAYVAADFSTVQGCFVNTRWLSAHSSRRIYLWRVIAMELLMSGARSQIGVLQSLMTRCNVIVSAKSK